MTTIPPPPSPPPPGRVASASPPAARAGLDLSVGGSARRLPPARAVVVGVVLVLAGSGSLLAYRHLSAAAHSKYWSDGYQSGKANMDETFAGSNVYNVLENTYDPLVICGDGLQDSYVQFTIRQHNDELAGCIAGTNQGLDNAKQRAEAGQSAGDPSAAS
jgi:hypothetical protein